MENKISQKIKYARIQKKLSVDAVAAALDISSNAYRKIEMNYTRLSVKRLYDIAEIFELDVLDFLDSKYMNSGNKSTNVELHVMEQHFKNMKVLYEKQIETLKEEIYFLREKILEANSKIYNNTEN